MKISRVTALPTALAAIAAVAFLASPGTAPAADPVSTLLAQSRAALGGDALDRVKTVSVTSKISVGGLTGTGTSVQEIGGPRFSERYNLAPLAGGDGYDGTVVWTADGSGLVWVDGGESGRAQSISQGFASGYALWSANRGGATVTSRGTQTAGGKSYDVLRVQPPGSAVPFDLWFDAATHLPARLQQTIGPIVSTTTVSQYRAVNGVMFPFAAHSESNDGNSTDSTVTQAVADVPGAAQALSKPASDVHDFSMLGGAQQTTVPFALSENHVYLNVMLNGKGPYRFIFDTGGANIVDPAVAKEIGAIGHGSVQGGGVGSATESVSFANVDTLQVGNAVLKNQLFGVAPTRLGFGVSAGQPVDGLIGFEVLSRYVTTFDYANNRVVLQMPGAGVTPPSGADVLPFVLDSRQPQFACGIDDIATQCTIDTGARDSITLFGPFVTAHPQVVPPAVSAVGVSGFGFGGASYGKLGRLSTLNIGSFTLTQVVGDFTTQDKGAFAMPFVAANVGGGIWKRFALTLDYGKQTMALVANSTLNDRDVNERSGMFLLNRGGKYVVYSIRPGTAGERAGILKGDTIATIDGKPASSMSLQAVRETFFGAPGTTVQLGLVAKDGTTRTVTLTLEDYV